MVVVVFIIGFLHCLYITTLVTEIAGIGFILVPIPIQLRDGLGGSAALALLFLLLPPPTVMIAMVEGVLRTL